MDKMYYSTTQYLRDLWGFIRPYKFKFFLAFFLRVSGDIANLFPAWALARIVTLLSNGKTLDEIKKEIITLLIGWLLTTLYRAIAKQGAKYFGYQVGENIGLNGYKKSLSHIYKLDLAWQEKENSGNKMKRINNGATGLTNTIRITFSNVIEGVINTIGIAILLSTQGLLVGGSLAVFIIFFYILSFHLTKRAVKQVKIVKRMEEDVEGLAFESINNIQTVKSLSLNRNMDSKLGLSIKQLLVEIKKRIFLFQTRSAVMAIVYSAYAIAMIAIIIYMVIKGYYEVGFIVLYYSYLQKVTVAIWELSDVTQELIVYKVWVSRMMAILKTKPTIEVNQSNQQKYPSNWERIEFKNISFSYGDRNNIKNFNLTIKRNEKIGIVGLSGAGKSTLFKLMLDLYEDYTGKILIGDKNLKDISREDFISHIAVVLQDTELFNVSLEDNIKLSGVSHNPEQDINNIFETAHLIDLINKLPEGKDTIVGEKGVKLSGGERQRVGIARALYRKPDLLLLDEATSHLDADSEKKIQSALDSFFDQVTAIVIAHRLSTLKNMDRIIVMDDGRVVEEGSFNELMNKGGHFTKLWEIQRI